MSLFITQTSAAKIVRAPHLAESDIRRLVRECGLHPLDAERLLSVPEHSSIDTSHDYAIVSLVLPWPSAHGLVGVDVRLIIGQKYLVAIGDTPAKTLAGAFATQEADQFHSTSSLDLAVAAISQLAAAVQRAVAAHPEAETAMRSMQNALTSFLKASTELGLQPTADQREQVALAIHRLKSIQLATPSNAISQPARRERQLAVGYVMASVAVLLVSLLFRS